jgi:probable addiction module antidote protein
LKTTVWDLAEHLETEDDIAAYLEAAFEEGDPAHNAAALGEIARTKVVAQITRNAGFGRESLSKALNPNTIPNSRRL